MVDSIKLDRVNKIPFNMIHKINKHASDEKL